MGFEQGLIFATGLYRPTTISQLSNGDLIQLAKSFSTTWATSSSFTAIDLGDSVLAISPHTLNSALSVINVIVEAGVPRFALLGVKIFYTKIEFWPRLYSSYHCCNRIVANCVVYQHRVICVISIPTMPSDGRCHPTKSEKIVQHYIRLLRLGR